MIRYMIWIFCLAFFLPRGMMAQDFEGNWEGILFQEGKKDTFSYVLSLKASGKDTYQGFARSQLQGRADSATFQLMAFWDGKLLVLQELEQLSPKEIKWCLKYAQLAYVAGDGTLSGTWKADGCSPGLLQLKKQGLVSRDTLLEEVVIPFSIEGSWTGVVSQSDRDYGFYYSLNLGADGRGTSYIVSEDNGGDATHNLSWEFSESDSSLVIKEEEVLRKNDANWKWCIKKADLKLSKEPHRYVLRGDWSGHLEGDLSPAGLCAPGIVKLEKPILTKTVEQVIETVGSDYDLAYERAIKVSHVLEVASDRLYIRVWDNGTVDGDIITIFLNGEQVANRYRVTKNKRNFPVTLSKDNNFLILHADDLGEVSPNTVGVAIDDGKREQVIIMSSNLSESGAVLIRQIHRN